MQDISAQAIFGGIPVKGRLPVSASKLFPYGISVQTTATRLKYTIPEELGIERQYLYPVDSMIRDAIQKKVFPGCQVWAARDGKVFYMESFGFHTYTNEMPVHNQDVYDMASLTKVAASTIAVMRMVDEKKLDIDEQLQQYLPYLSPRVSAKAEALTTKYIEQSGFVKLFFPEGEIDFVVSSPLTPHPAAAETILGRSVQVETSAEIVAKKVQHRGDEFTSRDLFDLALVATKEPDALPVIRHILDAKREAILARLGTHDAPLRKTFAALETMDFRPTYEECIAMVKQVLGGLPPPGG